MSVESIDNRYRIVRELGKGGMGMVYLVEDTLRDDRPAALKTIRADLLGEQNLTQFKYEFAALGRLQHPNLVKVYDFGAITGGPDYYFTMEYVPGDDLSAVAARYRGRVDYTWLYEITVQVCRALQYIHSRGFVHYDVKPRNIRIKPDGQVKLMDFGLIGEARGAGQLKIRGTPEYIAPEMIRGDEVDHRADLYSLGVTLYEIVAGQLPFTSDSSLEILRQHVEAAPEPLRHFVGNISEDLQNLILTLLDKSPARRYSSANAVVQTINALSHLDFPIETQETKRGYIQSGRFVGREALVARLQGLLMRMLQGQGRLVFVTGPEGVGKCRLVHELRLQAQLQRALVFEGICRAESRGPYRPWVPILRQVLAYQRSIKNDAMRLYGSALVKLMPELATQLGVETTNGPIPDEKRGLMDAVARFLLACDWPLVLVLSGLQCADVETIDLLAYLGQRAPEGRLLLCRV